MLPLLTKPTPLQVPPVSFRGGIRGNTKNGPTFSGQPRYTTPSQTHQRRKPFNHIFQLLSKHNRTKPHFLSGLAQQLLPLSSLPLPNNPPKRPSGTSPFFFVRTSPTSAILSLRFGEFQGSPMATQVLKTNGKTHKGAPLQKKRERERERLGQVNGSKCHHRCYHLNHGPHVRCDGFHARRTQPVTSRPKTRKKRAGQ